MNDYLIELKDGTGFRIISSASDEEIKEFLVSNGYDYSAIKKSDYKPV